VALAPPLHNAARVVPIQTRAPAKPDLFIVSLSSPAPGSFAPPRRRARAPARCPPRRAVCSPGFVSPPRALPAPTHVTMLRLTWKDRLVERQGRDATPLSACEHERLRGFPPPLRGQLCTCM
jgi:hypothetical protein